MQSIGTSSDKQALVMSAVSTAAVCLLTQLRCQRTQTVLSVMNIHVSWHQLKRPDIQCIEVCMYGYVSNYCTDFCTN